MAWLGSIEWLGDEPDSVAKLPGIERLSPSDLAAMKRTADELNVPVDSLATIISFESVFDPARVNKVSGATGLIQFMPSTAVILGTTVSALRAMSFQEQLPYVSRFYKVNRCTGQQDVGELYMCTFCPKLLGAPDATVIARKDVDIKGPCSRSSVESKVYVQNKGLDVNKDGVITVGDVREFIRKQLAGATGRVPIMDVPPETRSSSKRGFGLGWAAVIAAVAVIAYKTVG